MSFDQLRTFLKTLRFRLTLWNSAVVLILLLVNLVSIRAGLQFSLSRMMNEFLDEELDFAVQDFDRLSGDSEQLRNYFNRQATRHPRRRLFVQLIDNHSHLLLSSEQAPSMDLLPPSNQIIPRPERFGDYRIVSRPVESPDGSAMTLRVGCWLGRAQADMRSFTNILLVMGLGLLLIVPLGGYFLASRVTRPIARIIHIANRLRPTQLDERLPIRGTHDELDRLSQTINDLLDRIADYVRQGREFIANAAHQLRSPLTALQSSMEVALNADRSVEEYKDVLAVLLEECGQLRLLVNQLLLLAEADIGRLCLRSQPVRVDQIVKSSVEMFQVVAEAADVQLTACRVESVNIRGDGSRLWQVVNNLLDNAIKYTPAGGRVTLSLYLDQQTNACVLEVSDTGVGIAADDLPHIFERFYQSDKARQRESPRRGLGLGLSICQAVVNAHGGTIQVSGTLGQGTTFTVRLPECARLLASP